MATFPNLGEVVFIGNAIRATRVIYFRGTLYMSCMSILLWQTDYYGYASRWFIAGLAFCGGFQLLVGRAWYWHGWLLDWGDPCASMQVGSIGL